jgi:acetyltransferase-like isoleucine patch superfamily enzyme
MRTITTALVALLLPSALARVLLRGMGHRVGPGVQIGFSMLLVDRLVLQAGSRIGHFNVVRVRRLVLGREASVGRSNLLDGPLSVALGARAEIGNRNRILRGPQPAVTYGPSMLKLGAMSKITADHRIDCTCSVRFGSHSILAGSGSQLWTHGYVHEPQGHQRHRIDGGITIGNDVYIGSASIVTTGVRIADGVIVGAGATVARSLVEPGMYVSAGLRRVARPAPPQTRADLARVVAHGLCEPVYKKRPT